MKKVLIILFMICLLIITKKYALAAEQTSFELKINEDAYAKEYWPSTKTYTYPHLSLGYSTVYPEKRTELYFDIDLSELYSREIPPIDIETVDLKLTQFIQMAKDEFEVTIYDIPDPIPLNTLNWAVKPSLGEVITEFTMPVGGNARRIPITDQIKSAVERSLTNFGIAILMKKSSEPGAMYYSSRCQNGTYYQPQCEPGMEPSIEVILKGDLPPVKNVKYEETIINDLTTDISWELEDAAICTIDLSDLNGGVNSTGWEALPHQEIKVPEYGQYIFQIKCKRSEASTIVTNSETYPIEFIEKKDIPEEIESGQAPEDDTREETFTTPVQDPKLEPPLPILTPDKEGTENLETRAIISPTPLFYSPNQPTIISIPPRPKDPLFRDLEFFLGNNNDEQDTNKYLICTRSLSDNRISCSYIKDPFKMSACKMIQDKTSCSIEHNIPKSASVYSLSTFCQIFPILFTDKCVSVEIQPVLSKISLFANNVEIKYSKQTKYLLASDLPVTEPTQLTVVLKLFLPNYSNKAIYQKRSYLNYEIDHIKASYKFPFPKTHGVTQWHGFTAFDSPHTGIDFGVKKEAIYALSSGIVRSAGYDNYLGECNSGGYYVNIEHNDGRHSLYLHLDKHDFLDLALRKGSLIKEGQLIGYTGNSGAYNCQPLKHHLHLELRDTSKQATHIDPVPHIKYDWNKVITLDSKRIPGRLSGDNPHPSY